MEFDDGVESAYAVARTALAEHRMVATFFVNSGALGAPGRLSVHQLRVLESDGHEIGGHTVDHLHLPTLGHAELVHQICDDRTALLNEGFAVKNFAYPFGEVSREAAAVAASCGYSSARGVGGLRGISRCWFCPYAESIPPHDLYHTRTALSVRDDTTLEDMKRAVTRAREHGGGWVQIVFHQICDGCGRYSTRESTFHRWLDWLSEERARGHVVVLPVRDALRNGRVEQETAPALGHLRERGP